MLRSFFRKSVGLGFKTPREAIEGNYASCLVTWKDCSMLIVDIMAVGHSDYTCRCLADFCAGIYARYRRNVDSFSF